LIAFARLISTWCYVGYFPKAPGTAGSVAAITMAWVLNRYFDVSALKLALLGLILMIPGIWAADITAKSSGMKDPQIVVVDEVVGQWITLAGATTLNWKSWLIALALFRIFDMTKPTPVRQLEKLPGGFGIVMDDVMAGVYAAVLLFGAGKFGLY